MSRSSPNRNRILRWAALGISSVVVAGFIHSPYLGELLRRYGWPGAGAAYHAGPTRYDEYLTSGRPLPRATLEYVARIERSVPNHASDSPPDVGESLSASTFATSPNTSPRAGLFVPLRQSSRQTNSRP